MIRKIHFFHTIDELQDSYANNDTKLILLFGEKTPLNIQQLSLSFNNYHGAIFPYVIYEGTSYDNGILALELDHHAYVTLVCDISAPDFQPISSQTQSMLLIIDGLSPYIDHFLQQMFVHTDSSLHIFGGGAGKLTLRHEHVIFDKNGIYRDSALMVAINRVVGIGVQHGWKTMLTPLIATATDANHLKQINYKNASEFYKNAVFAHSGKQLNHDNFFDIAKGYPIGIETFNNETVVRDPISYDENGLYLVGSIHENAVISILHGTTDWLIDAAAHAGQKALTHLGENPEFLFVIDCVSRSLFLGEDFHKELDAIAANAPQAPIFGVLSLGEIANNNDRFIEFFNKTCVVGAF